MCILDPNEVPEGLSALIQECEDFDPQVWYEGWKSTDITHRFGRAKARYQKENQNLIDLYSRIKQTKVEMSDAEWRTWEECLDIVLPN